MALVDTDLFLVQDATTKTNYKVQFTNLRNDLAATIDLDAVYVRNDGDNITGDITLGPAGSPVITLDVDNGNISADGTITGQTGQFVRVEGFGGLEIYGDPVSSRAIDIDSDSNVTIDKTLTVESDAEFKTSVEVTNEVTLGGKLTANNAQFTTKIEGTSGLNIYSSPTVQKGIEIDAAGNVNIDNDLTLTGDNVVINGDLTVTGDTDLADVTGDKFTGKFVGDGSELTDLPVVPGLWQKSGSNLSPMQNSSSLVDIVDITISGELKADLIDGGEYV